MKIKNIILLFFFLIPIFGNQYLVAQTNTKIRAQLNVRNVRLTNQNTLKFDLFMIRTTDDWERFANGTFQFKLFPDSVAINTITLDTTDLPANTDITGGVLPTDGYKQNFQIYPERLSITCLGPTTFDKCTVIPKDKELLIGHYTLTTTQPIEEQVEWKTELTYYQACAYKIGHDSLFYNDQGHIRYYKDDNVPLVNGNTGENSILYLVDETNPHDSLDVIFTATYMGDLKIALEFKITNEFKIIGYTIIRKYQDNPPNSPFEYPSPENPPITIFTYAPASPQFNPIMISQGWEPNVTHIYNGLTDVVQYRGGAYWYQLWGTFVQDTVLKDSLIAEDSAEIPALIIAQAAPMPNPFDKETTIKYQLVEDAYIKAEIWDLVGRKLDEINLIDEEESFKLDGSGLKTAGWHYFIFKPIKVSSQGLFNIVIDAIPKNPISQVENGRAIIKVQFLIEKKAE